MAGEPLAEEPVPGGGPDRAVNALDGGHLVGRYRIVRFLGAGAMGEVYLADDPQIDRRLAIKTVRLVGRPQEIEDRKKRLLREARAAGRLLHPNVVTLFDAGEAEGMLYLAFEYVEGTDLAHRLDERCRDPRLSLREALRVVRQAADALDYAHGQGIVHRDIKPSNILLDRSGRVKVADFGIAKMAGQSTELTMAGSVMGSPQYLSPEQIRGEDLDGRSDIFSLGVVLYEILSGKRPFEGDTITTLVYQILHKDPPPVSELRAVPPRARGAAARMLAKSRDERLAHRRRGRPRARRDRGRAVRRDPLGPGRHRCAGRHPHAARGAPPATRGGRPPADARHRAGLAGDDAERAAAGADALPRHADGVRRMPVAPAGVAGRRRRRPKRAAGRAADRRRPAGDGGGRWRPVVHVWRPRQAAQRRGGGGPDGPGRDLGDAAGRRRARPSSYGGTPGPAGPGGCRHDHRRRPRLRCAPPAVTPEPPSPVSARRLRRQPRAGSAAAAAAADRAVRRPRR